MPSADTIEVSIRLNPFSPEAAEIAVAYLSDLPYEAFTVEDPQVKAYIPRDLYDARQLRIALDGLDVQADFQATLIPSQNWNAEWESRFDPIVIGRTVTVKAPFHTGLPRTRFQITLRPQMAFGTGHHQTTALMLEALLRNEGRVRGHVVLDMGCGTGVLAILAAKLGADKVFAFDIDPVAARSAYDNVRLNRTSRRTEVRCGDASLLQMNRYDLILANIHRNIILEDLPTYARSLRKGGLLLVSGFYPSDAEAVRQRAGACGLTCPDTREREGWACLEFEKVSGPLRTPSF